MHDYVPYCVLAVRQVTLRTTCVGCGLFSSTPETCSSSVLHASRRALHAHGASHVAVVHSYSQAPGAPVVLQMV
jgi:hypothetical protein